MRPACVGRRRGALLLSWILACAPCRAISSRISGLRSGGPDVGSGRRTCEKLNGPLITGDEHPVPDGLSGGLGFCQFELVAFRAAIDAETPAGIAKVFTARRSEEHTSELQSRGQ